MSSMMMPGGPPPSIDLPTAPPDPGAGADAGGGDSGGSPEDLVSQAIDLFRQALDMEPDHEDKLLLEKVTTMAQQYLATQQKTVDQAMGAGPGAKAVRKASGGASGGY